MGAKHVSPLQFHAILSKEHRINNWHQQFITTNRDRQTKQCYRDR
jgi:hypothetical protein